MVPAAAGIGKGGTVAERRAPAWHNASIISRETSMSLRRKLLVYLPLALLLIVSGCKVDTINYFPPHPASVRVINLMTDAPSIDVQVNGSPAFSAVAFQSFTGYQSFDNQTTSFSVSVTGSATPLISFSIPLAGEEPYTLVVMGTTGFPSATLLAEVANAPSNGNIQLAVFNAAINQPTIDIYVTAPGVDIGTVGPNYSYVRYNGVSLNLAFSPSTYQIRVTPAGTKTVIYDSGGSALTPNVALTLIMYSKGSGVLVNAQVLQSQGPGVILDSIFAQIKNMNGASIVGPVNQLLDTLAVASDIGYASTTPYAQVPAGYAAVNYEASSTPGATLASVPFTLEPAVDYSAFITGLPGSQQAYVLTDFNIPPMSSNVRLRFVNTSWDSNPVNVAVNNVPLATAVAYPTASAYTQITGGTYPVTFTDAVTGAVVLTLENVALTTGTMTIYLIGPAAAPGGVVTLDN